MLTQTSTSDCLHRSILVVDIEGYSRPARTNLIRARLRGALYLLLDQAIGTLGDGADLYEPPKDEGDGALVLFQPQVPKNRLLHPLVPSLVEGLASYNAGVPERERMRLRVVLHAGELLSDPHGYFGEDLDHAFGLLNSETLRATLAGTPGPLVLLVTDRIHQGIVKHGLSGIDPATYQPLDLSVKGARVRAWLHIPAITGGLPLGFASRPGAMAGASLLSPPDPRSTGGLPLGFASRPGAMAGASLLSPPDPPAPAEAVA